jgi:hypothetical protein
MNPSDFKSNSFNNAVAAGLHPSEVAIPPVLQASVKRHEANLARLLQSFRSAGMGEAEIEAAVTVVIDSYKHELLQAIRSLTATGCPAEDP